MSSSSSFYTGGKPTLLTFLASDPDPPIPLSTFWSNWDWFVKPLLLAFQQSNYSFKDQQRLPPLFPADLFAAHRLHARQLYEQLKERSPQSSLTAEQVIDRWEQAHTLAVRQANEAVFGRQALANSNGSVAVSTWVQQLCRIVDPLSFPIESAVYASQLSMAAALEMVERNANLLESNRRQLVMQNERLYAEVQRLTSAVFAIESLPANLNRIVNQTTTKTTR